MAQVLVRVVCKMKAAPEGHGLVRRVDRQGEVLIWCRLCEAESGTKIDVLLQAGVSRHNRAL